MTKCRIPQAQKRRSSTQKRPRGGTISARGSNTEQLRIRGSYSVTGKHRVRGADLTRGIRVQVKLRKYWKTNAGPQSNAPKQARASLPVKGEPNPSPDGSPLRARPLAQERRRRRCEEEEGWSCGGKGGVVWIGVETRRRGKPPGISWRLVR
jgi:hypothetical protein